jgi:hypothetical protein
MLDGIVTKKTLVLVYLGCEGKAVWCTAKVLLVALKKLAD